MNPYNQYVPPYMQPQGMAIQNLPNQSVTKPTVVPYHVESAEQMLDASDILKDIAKSDSAMSKACYYDSMRGTADDKKY